MAKGGQHKIFNFDTSGAEFDVEVEVVESVSYLTLTRTRPDKPDDTMSFWVKTEWLETIKKAIDAALVTE